MPSQPAQVEAFESFVAVLWAKASADHGTDLGRAIRQEIGEGWIAPADVTREVLVIVDALSAEICL